MIYGSASKPDGVHCGCRCLGYCYIVVVDAVDVVAVCHGRHLLHGHAVCLIIT